MSISPHLQSSTHLVHTRCLTMSHPLTHIFALFAGLHEQLDLHHRPAPQVLAVFAELLRALPWPRPFRSRYATPLSNTCAFNPTLAYCKSPSNHVSIRFSLFTDAIPGDARWCRGEAVSLKSARDSMVSLEVAAHSQLALGKANSF